MSKNTTLSITLKLKGNAGTDLTRINLDQIKQTQKINTNWNMAATAQARFTDQVRRSTAETKQTGAASEQLLRTNRMLEGVLRQQAIQTRLLSGQLKAQNRDYTLQTRMLSEQARHARDLQRALADAARSQRDMSRNQPKTGGGMGGMVGGIASGAAAAYALARNPLERARSFETKIFDATASITGGFKGMSPEQAKTANLQLSQIAKDTVVQSHGTVEGVGDAAGILAASGLYRSIEEMRTPLQMVAKGAFASGASEQDMANLVRQMKQFGIKDQDLQTGIDRMLASGYAAGFELKDMARLMPPVLAAAKLVGYSDLDGLSTVLTHVQLNRKDTGIPSEATDNVRDMYVLMGQNHLYKTMARYFKVQEDDALKRFGVRQNKVGIDTNTTLANKLEQGQDVAKSMMELMKRQLSKNKNYVRLSDEIAALKAQENPDASVIKNKIAAQRMVVAGTFGEIFHNQQSSSAINSIFNGMLNKGIGGFDDIQEVTNDSVGTTKNVAKNKEKFEFAKAEVLMQQNILNQIGLYNRVSERLGNFEQGLANTMKANEALTEAAYAAALALGVLAAARVGGALLGGGAAAAGGAAAGAAGGGLVAAARTVLRAPVGALAGSTVGRLALGAGVGIAGTVGYGAGTLLNKGLVEGTDFGDSIGSAIAEVLALFGNDTAQQALESNKRFDEMIRLQEQQLEAARIANIQRNQQQSTPQPVAPYSPRGLMLSMSDAVNQEAQRGAPMWRP